MWQENDLAWEREAEIKLNPINWEKKKTHFFVICSAGELCLLSLGVWISRARAFVKTNLIYFISISQGLSGERAKCVVQKGRKISHLIFQLFNSLGFVVSSLPGLRYFCAQVRQALLCRVFDVKPPRSGCSLYPLCFGRVAQTPVCNSKGKIPSLALFSLPSSRPGEHKPFHVIPALLTLLGCS